MSVVDEATAKDYQSYQRRVSKDLADMGGKRRKMLYEDLGTGKGQFLVIQCTGCGAIQPGDEKLDPQKFKDRHIDKCPVCGAPLRVSAKTPTGDPGPKAEWEVFEPERTKAFATLTLPPFLFETKFYNQYLREIVALKLLRLRELNRLDGCSWHSSRTTRQATGPSSRKFSRELAGRKKGG